MATSFSASGTPATVTNSTVRFPQATVVMPIHLADLANSQTLKMAIPYRFRVESVVFRVGGAATTASKAATLTLKISGTTIATQPASATIGLTSANCTPVGATVALSSSATIATGIDVTTNIGAAGDTIEAAVSGAGTPFVEGSGWLEWTISNIESVQ